MPPTSHPPPPGSHPKNPIAPPPLPEHTIALTLQYLLPPLPPLPAHLLSTPLRARHALLHSPPSDASYFCWPSSCPQPERLLALLDSLSASDLPPSTRSPGYAGMDEETLLAGVDLGGVVRVVWRWEDARREWAYHDALLLPAPIGTPIFAFRTAQEAWESVHAPPPPPPPPPQPGRPRSEADYWAAYEARLARDVPEDGVERMRGHEPGAREEGEEEEEAEEDAYWARYGVVHGSGDSTVPSPVPGRVVLRGPGGEEGDVEMDGAETRKDPATSPPPLPGPSSSPARLRPPSSHSHAPSSTPSPPHPSRPAPPTPPSSFSLRPPSYPHPAQRTYPPAPSSAYPPQAAGQQWPTYPPPPSAPYPPPPAGPASAQAQASGSGAGRSDRPDGFPLYTFYAERERERERQRTGSAPSSSEHTSGGDARDPRPEPDDALLDAMRGLWRVWSAGRGGARGGDGDRGERGERAERGGAGGGRREEERERERFVDVARRVVRGE